MSRIVIRLAVPNDQRRFLAGGLISGPPPANMSWEQRLTEWFAEQARGQRLMLIADDGSNIFGCVHLVFKLAETVNDPEVADGKEVAMMEHLRILPKTPTTIAEALANQLEREAETLARRRNMTRLTFRIPMELTALVNQARGWGFVEFRVMALGGKQSLFLRKRLVEFRATPGAVPIQEGQK